jgi:hypothetical protein
MNKCVALKYKINDKRVLNATKPLVIELGSLSMSEKGQLKYLNVYFIYCGTVFITNIVILPHANTGRTTTCQTLSGLHDYCPQCELMIVISAK